MMSILSIYKITAFKLSASCLTVKLVQQQVIQEIYTGQKLNKNSLQSILHKPIHQNKWSKFSISFCASHKWIINRQQWVKQSSET